MSKLKYSPANVKIKSLGQVAELAGYLEGKRKVYSFDILSGVNCPYANKCKSQVVESADGSRRIQDGEATEFRCFSASQELIFKNTYLLRKANGEAILPEAAKSPVKAADMLEFYLPKNAGIVRIHVAGDFKTRNYFTAFMLLAERRPDILFYAYTKSLPFTYNYFLYPIPNLVLTASKGGLRDDMIDKYNLRQAIVVYSKQEAADLQLPIDHDDSHAASRGGNFALLIHGIQPKGSEASKALQLLNGEGSYSRKKGGK